MRIFILIIVILTILGIVESKSIIPSTSFGILSTLSMLAAFIKSLNIHSYYLIIPNITFTTSGILTTLLMPVGVLITLAAFTVGLFRFEKK